MKELVDIIKEGTISGASIKSLEPADSGEPTTTRTETPTNERKKAKKASPVCWQFKKKGQCSYGESCKFRHVSQAKRAEDLAQKSKGPKRAQGKTNSTSPKNIKSVDKSFKAKATRDQGDSTQSKNNRESGRGRNIKRTVGADPRANMFAPLSSIYQGLGGAPAGFNYMHTSPSLPSSYGIARPGLTNPLVHYGLPPQFPYQQPWHHSIGRYPVSEYFQSFPLPY